jgi:iron(III) transport system permease protein
MESPSYGLAMASSVLLILIAGVGLLGYFRIMRQAERYATVTGKGYRPRVIDLGRWRWAASAFILFYVCVAVVLPLVVLVWASLLPVYQVPSERALASLSFQHYLNIVQDRRFVAVLQNTLVVGLVVSVGGLVLASLVSWIVIRLRPRGARLLDFLAFIPYAIPGIVVAFAYMVLLLALQSPLYGTIWALVLAYSIVFLPIATRFTHASMAQISEELEHAAAISGAGFLTVLRRITLPLMLPALVGAGLYLFLLCTKVLSVAAILFSTKATILPTYIMELYKLPGSIGRVGAISVMMVLALTLVALVIRKLERDAFVAAA